MVAHGQPHAIGVAREHQVGPAAGGVPSDVGQRLLGNAVDDELYLGWQSREVGRNVLGHLEAELLREPVGEHSQCARQAEIVECLGS